MKITYVVGARPNFMKVAPIIKAVEAEAKKAGANNLEQELVHTGQHYSKEMSQLFFDQLGLPIPDVNLEVGSGSHGVQTGQIMAKFERVLLESPPNIVVVVGDVNSTAACAIDAKKMGIHVAHVEAGLRSYDRSMPEEINRLVTDSISDSFFVTDMGAYRNLMAEGVEEEKIYFVGNVMIDTLFAHKGAAEKLDILMKLGIEGEKFGVVTLHRPSNVDNPDVLANIVSILNMLAFKMKIVFPVHPRTKGKLIEFGMLAQLELNNQIILINPLGYLEFLNLLSNASFVMSDSGGIQEETTVLGVPCLTMRENTERPITILEGTNQLVNADKNSVFRAFNDLQRANFKCDTKVPDKWDGLAGERIAKIILSLNV